MVQTVPLSSISTSLTANQSPVVEKDALKKPSTGTGYVRPLISSHFRSAPPRQYQARSAVGTYATSWWYSRSTMFKVQGCEYDLIDHLGTSYYSWVALPSKCTLRPRYNQQTDLFVPMPMHMYMQFYSTSSSSLCAFTALLSCLRPLMPQRTSPASPGIIWSN